MPNPFESRPTGTAVDPTPTVEPSDQFLSSLTAAMRRVADDARETSLADARAAIAAKIAAMRAAASARADELRTRAEQDVAGIAEWSRAEVARIESETQRKTEQRHSQLAEQLDEHDRRSAAEIAALEAQVEAYEGELALFFAQLGEISDPDTFIAAARRMPRLPRGDAASPAGDGEVAPEPFVEASAGPGAVDEAEAVEHEERLRDLGIDHSGATDAAAGDGVPTNGTEPDADGSTTPAVAGEVALDEPIGPVAAAPEPVPAVGDATVDTTTTIAAVGLGSFGAVTSFKTALEKADGVNGVRLSLGTGGEFMYTVTHRPDVDLAAVAGAAQPGASVQRGGDGVVRLSAGKRH